MSAGADHRHGSQGQGLVDPTEVLRHARETCAAKGLRLTAQRASVLETLATSRRPLGAYDLAEALGSRGRISAVSVYRALEFLVEAGLVHRLSIRPAFVVCSGHHDHEHATVFLLCRNCGRVDEVASSRIEDDLTSVAEGAGFRSERQAVEVEGRCRDCADTAA